MKLCKHDKHRVINHIRSPKWSTNQILISTDAISDNTKHYLIQFTDKSPKKKYGWFYMSGKDICKSKMQPNGRGMMYAVDLDKRQEFEPINDCEHNWR